MIRTFLVVCSFAVLLASHAHAAGTAWVWANRPTTTSYTPYPSYSYNSNGVSNSVRRLGQGRYRVLMPLVLSPGRGGNVQVTAYGSGSQYCKVRAWGVRGNVDLHAYVSCFDASGSPADSRFTAVYHDELPDGRDLAFTWAHDPTPDPGYLPSGQYHYNHYPSEPGDPENFGIRREGTGRYYVRVHGWNSREATFLVTAYGTTNNRCSIADHAHANAWVSRHRYWIRGHELFVRCTTPAGVLVDERFTMAVTANRVVGSPHLVGAYAHADQPTASFYYPAAENDWNGLDPSRTRISRISRGRYQVRFASLAGTYGKSSALVTAGDASHHCKVNRWRTEGVFVVVDVDCYAPSGARSDSRFFVSFLTDRRR